jgi:hypothetical protein
LHWGYLTALIGCWGKKTRCLVTLSLVLIPSRLTILVVLLLFAEGTTFGITVDADAGSAADILEGDSA